MEVIFGYGPNSGEGIIGGVIVLCIMAYSLANDHVVHDKIAGIYNRVVKRHPF